MSRTQDVVNNCLGVGFAPSQLNWAFPASKAYRFALIKGVSRQIFQFDTFSVSGHGVAYNI